MIEMAPVCVQSKPSTYIQMENCQTLRITMQSQQVNLLIDRRVCMFAASPHQSTKFLTYFKDELQTQSPAMKERIIKIHW